MSNDSLQPSGSQHQKTATPTAPSVPSPRPDDPHLLQQFETLLPFARLLQQQMGGEARASRGQMTSAIQGLLSGLHHGVAPNGDVAHWLGGVTALVNPPNEDAARLAAPTTTALGTQVRTSSTIVLHMRLPGM